MNPTIEQSRAASSSDSDHWNPLELLRKVENDIDLASELVQMFREDAPQMSLDMISAVRCGEPERLASAAHAYRGSAAAIGATAAAKAAGSIETAARAGRTDIDLELAHFQMLDERLLGELEAATGAD